MNKNWPDQLSGHFTFSHRDRIAIIILILAISVTFLAPQFLPGDQIPSALSAQDSLWISRLRASVISRESERNPVEPGREEENPETVSFPSHTIGHYRKAHPAPFNFDPNTLTVEGWKKLGLRDKTIGIIQNYLSKGGRFSKPEDLSKIYGLFPDEYARLEPYIRIAGKESQQEDYRPHKMVPTPVARTWKPAMIDINQADTTAFISLPGIGSKLAGRIVNFREKLGGFYRISQVGETFGLPDSTFRKIMPYLRLEDFTLRKININTATIEELKTHPYLKYSVANALVAYRNEHGTFSRLEDLKKVMAITEEIYEKILPYLREE